jgi:hypothetical protein
MFHLLQSGQGLRLARKSGERPWSHVPVIAYMLCASLLAAQLLFASFRPAPLAFAQDLPSPLTTSSMRILTLSDSHAAQRLGLLWLQSYDAQPGVQLALSDIDAIRLIAWLDALHHLAPSTDYAVFLATNVYFGVESEPLRRALVPWIRERFLEQPSTRWFEMSRTVQLVRRHLNDIELAVDLVQDIRNHASEFASSRILQLDAFLLEANNDDEAAAALIAMYLREGFYRSEHEARFLLERFEEIHNRLHKPVQ